MPSGGKRSQVTPVLLIVLLALVPVWIRVPGLGVPIYLVVVLLLFAYLLRELVSKLYSGEGIKITLVDLLFGAFVGLSVLASILGSMPSWLTTNMFVFALVPYLVGRTHTQLLLKILPVLGVLFAIWALLEFVFGFRVFENTNDAVYWTQIQYRADWARAEASFGHAIALGGFLSICLAYILIGSGRLKLLQVTILISGLIATLSRGPLLACGVVILVWVVFYTKIADSVLKIFLLSTAAGAVFVGYQLFLTATLEAGSEEMQRSGEARIGQLERTLPWVRPLGAASNAWIDGNDGNRVVFYSDRIIDSTFLYFGLHYGAVVAVLLLVMVLYLVMANFKPSRNPHVLALIGQTPIILVTSPISQWQIFFFMMIGACAGQLSLKGKRVSGEEYAEKSV